MQTDAVIQHITDWLADYNQRSGTGGFVVGVSGGIDSAVSSSLAARTGQPVLCLEMPIHQSANQVTRARKHIDALERKYENVSSQEIELTAVYEQLIRAFPKPDGTGSDELPLVNTRARVRMTTLYYFAALHGRIVVGTGNKVEDFGIGFFTKYGDGGVDVSPIADLMKTEVYELARQMDVIDEILVAPPTDGLWGDDRTDEDQIGASYPELEWAMGFDGDPSTLDDRQRRVLDIYQRANAANRHKMDPIPVCQIPDALR